MLLLMVAGITESRCCDGVVGVEEEESVFRRSGESSASALSRKGGAWHMLRGRSVCKPSKHAETVCTKSWRTPMAMSIDTREVQFCLYAFPSRQQGPFAIWQRVEWRERVCLHFKALSIVSRVMILYRTQSGCDSSSSTHRNKTVAQSLRTTKSTSLNHSQRSILSNHHPQRKR